MPINSGYNSGYEAYEKALRFLENNLQYLEENKLTSEKHLSIQRSIIDSLKFFKEQSEFYISGLELENFRLAKGKISEIEKLKLIKESLESICIIHGIMDFPMWMAKGNANLVNEAVNMYHSGGLQLSEKLMEYFDTLSAHEKDMLDKILYKKFYERQAELQAHIDKLTKS